MRQPIINLSNSNNWREVWAELIRAQRVVTDIERYYPIRTIEMPVQLESPIFAVLIENQQAAQTWRFAGNMTQSIQTGILGFGTNDVELAEPKKLWLNRVCIHIFPKITSTFSLKFDVPHWFEEASITVWEYLGNYGDTTEELIKQVREENLTRIEQKIDDISTYGGN